jgi:glycosyltransferase involved in cell wall biosynthesis
MRKIIHEDGDDDKLNCYYKNARAFVYPSLYEGFGLPILEAMQMGCPVICSSTSSFPEVAGNAGIYFNPVSVESIVTTLENHIFDDHKLEHFCFKREKEC